LFIVYGESMPHPYTTKAKILKEISEEELVQLTNDGPIGSDNAGDTDGSTGTIANMSETSFFGVDGYVTVSAGFPTTGPYKVLSKTADSITINEISNSVQSNVIVATATNDDNINEAIERADDLCDSYCGEVADVPFSTVPGIIEQHSKTIAIYFIFARRSVVPEIRKDNYKDAIAHLKDIATGKATIGTTTADDYEDKAEISSGDRIFTREKLKGF
jgi:phage gp36-like protein